MPDAESASQQHLLMVVTLDSFISSRLAFFSVKRGKESAYLTGLLCTFSSICPVFSAVIVTCYCFHSFSAPEHNVILGGVLMSDRHF